jgi:hypothetical protein
LGADYSRRPHRDLHPVLWWGRATISTLIARRLLDPAR